MSQKANTSKTSRSDQSRSTSTQKYTQGRCNGFPKKRRYDNFKGANEKLSTVIFDYGGTGNQDMFVKSKKKIEIYIGQNFDNPRDIQSSIENLELYTILMPPAPADYGAPTADKTASFMYEKKVQRYILREESLQNNIVKAFALIWGQCTDSLKAKLESVPNWRDIYENKDSIRLLKEMKNIIYKFEDQLYPMCSLYRANQLIYTIGQ